jgi:4-aminobutyrate aminotransferase
LLPGIVHLPYATPYRCPIARAQPECKASCDCSAAFAGRLFAERLSPDEVAAVIVEPVLGEGGYIFPPRDFLQYWRDFCDEHGALLIFDEIQTAVGRTGRMFAAELFEVTPDVILLAKGLASGMPIGAIIAKESVMSWDRGSHGSTFGGNPVCCAAALATLDLVERSLAANAERMGALLLDGFRRLQATHEVIGDVRGAALMIGLEFVKDRTSAEPYDALPSRIENAAFQKGLLLLPCGRSAIRICPPLVIDEYDVQTGLRIFGEVLDELVAVDLYGRPSTAPGARA